MTSVRLVALWGVALVIALGVLAVREEAPAELIVRGSESGRAGILLEQRFDQEIRGSGGERASPAPGVAIATAITCLFVFAVVAAGRSARAGLAIGFANSSGRALWRGSGGLVGPGRPGGGGGGNHRRREASS